MCQVYVYIFYPSSVLFNSLALAAQDESNVDQANELELIQHLNLDMRKLSRLILGKLLFLQYIICSIHNTKKYVIVSDR